MERKRCGVVGLYVINVLLGRVRLMMVALRGWDGCLPLLVNSRSLCGRGGMGRLMLGYGIGQLKGKYIVRKERK